jgi:hypothetical protein
VDPSSGGTGARAAAAAAGGGRGLAIVVGRVHRHIDGYVVRLIRDGRRNDIDVGGDDGTLDIAQGGKGRIHDDDDDYYDDIRIDHEEANDVARAID